MRQANRPGNYSVLVRCDDAAWSLSRLVSIGCRHVQPFVPVVRAEVAFTQLSTREMRLINRAAFAVGSR